jgi:hypothetical protein
MPRRRTPIASPDLGRAGCGGAVRLNGPCFAWSVIGRSPFAGSRLRAALRRAARGAGVAWAAPRRFGTGQAPGRLAGPVVPHEAGRV